MKKVIKDEYGVKYKFPDRDCKECKKYPCFKEFYLARSNFAKYGCKDYKV